MRHECGEFGSVLGGNLVEAAVDGVAEVGERFVVTTVKDIALDELPQAFDEVEVRRVGRQELQPDVERCGQSHDQRTVLIAGVVQHECDGFLQSETGDLMQQFAHRVRRHGLRRRDADSVFDTAFQAPRTL